MFPRLSCICYVLHAVALIRTECKIENTIKESGAVEI